MLAPDNWMDTAEALELTIEGRRLIVREVADTLRHLWTRARGRVGGLRHITPRRRS